MRHWRVTREADIVGVERRRAVIIWLLVLVALGGARGGRPTALQGVGARAPLAPMWAVAAKRERDDGKPTQHAGDKRLVVKQKECWSCRRRFEAPAPARALITHFNYDTDRIN